MVRALLSSHFSHSKGLFFAKHVIMNRKALPLSALKMIIPPTLALCLFVGTVFAVILPSFNASIMERKKETTMQLIDMAIGILDHFEKKVTRGLISQQEAKTQAISQIRALRYGKELDDYFWISNLESTIIMHPHRPELEGENTVTLVDENIKYVFQKMTDIATSKGAGFINYMWRRQRNLENIAPKLSYVKLFPQWQWIIGTGLYLDDTRKEISTLTTKLSTFALLALLLLSVLSLYNARQSIINDKRRRKAEALLQQQHDQLEQTVQQRTTQLTTINKKLVTEAGERRKAEQKIKSQNIFLNDVIESLPFPFYVINIEDHSISLANQHAVHEGTITSTHKCSALAHSKENEELRCPEAGHSCPVVMVQSSKKHVTVEHTHYDRHGKERYVEVHGYPVFDALGNIIQVIKTVVDITSSKKSANKLAKISITDELTGLLNRRGFLLLAQKQLQIAKRKGCNLFLMYADLDNLKPINDTLGHDIGDSAILEAGKLFQTVFREADIIGRVGGDEFTVLFSCEEDTRRSPVPRLIERLEKRLFTLNNSNNLLFELSISHGVTMFDNNAPTTVEELMKAADHLMYQEKKRKKGSTNEYCN